MKFTEVLESEITKASRKKVNSVMDDLMEYYESDKDLVRVEAYGYCDNNNLRRTIQNAIERENLPMKVFMSNGNVYLRKEKLCV